MKHRITFNQFRSTKLFELVCEKLYESYAPDRIAHLILSFTGAKHSPKVVNQRYRSVASVVRSVFGDHVKIVEAHKDRTVHFHVLGVLQNQYTTIQDASNFMLSRGLRWGRDVKLKVPTKRKLRGYKGIGVFFLSPIDNPIGLRKYLQKGMTCPVLRKVPGWARAKLWAPSKRLRVNWKMAMHGPAFDCALQLMVAEHGLKTEDELKQKLGRFWSVDVLQRKWEEELRAVLGESRYAAIDARLLKRLRYTDKLTVSRINALRKKPRTWQQLRLAEMYSYRDLYTNAVKAIRINLHYRREGRAEGRRIAITRQNPTKVIAMADLFSTRPHPRRMII
jgi:hypothetical protein